jgi:hypothetical protein
MTYRTGPFWLVNNGEQLTADRLDGGPQRPVQDLRIVT